MTPKHSNSFDALRLFGALCVFWSHQLGAAGFAEPTVPLLDTTAGGFGVALFFAISGYLVTISLLNRGSTGSYLWSRVLRIYPGLIVCLLATMLAGAAVSSLPAAEYFGRPETWGFVWRNLLSLFVDRQFTLPGVLAEARWPAVNASLWTIPYETAAYLLLAGLFVVGAAASFRWRVVAAALLALGLYVFFYTAVPWPEDRSTWFTRAEPHFLVRFAIPFLTGAAVAALSGERAMLLVAGAMAIVAAAASTTILYEALAWAIAALLVIRVGISQLLAWYPTRKVGDLSYGIYLYAYPVQNYAIAKFFDGTNFAAVTIVSFAVIVALAAVSWHIIEKPALRLRERKLAPVRRPAEATQP
ncbi:hypothetical protein ASE63_22500 [Bosea sp. Root381]|uniref:acyltransferase family protein n=1 Tax=Bosea sp. Root381 TaxID=1736524 RepID=UPI0006FDA4A3|nr:acyltransferase [Bosea sp. Root381]KRE07473.1 hypothetical protein ASE63_22500 [Bosea sp. Root381]